VLAAVISADAANSSLLLVDAEPDTADHGVIDASDL